MVDAQGALPARYRHVRWRGLLDCCLDSIRATERLTTPGSELECRVCQAVLLVDEEGSWCWAGKRAGVVASSHAMSRSDPSDGRSVRV